MLWCNLIFMSLLHLVLVHSISTAWRICSQPPSPLITSIELLVFADVLIQIISFSSPIVALFVDFRAIVTMVIITFYLKHFFYQKSAAKPVQAPQGYSSAPYVGSGAPSSMYLGVPPYGSSLFNGAPIPPYDGPFSGGSAYHYNYGSRLSAGSPYRPLHLSGPPPYSSGSMMGNGMCCFSCSIVLVGLNFSFFGLFLIFSVSGEKMEMKWRCLVLTYFQKTCPKNCSF